VDDYQKKSAAFGDALRQFGGHVGNTALNAGAGALATAAVGGLAVAAGKLYDAATKSRDFRRMLDANPDLAEHHAQNPGGMNQFFSSLRTMNPAFSRDPLVAGHFMRQMAGIDTQGPGAVAGGYLMPAIDARRHFEHSPIQQLMMQGAAEGTKAYMTEAARGPGRQQELAQQRELASVRGDQDRNLAATQIKAQRGNIRLQDMLRRRGAQVQETHRLDPSTGGWQQTEETTTRHVP